VIGQPRGPLRIMGHPTTLWRPDCQQFRSELLHSGAGAGVQRRKGFVRKDDGAVFK